MMQKIKRRLVLSLPDVIKSNDIVSYFSFSVSKIDCTEVDKRFQEVLVTRLSNLYKMINIECFQLQQIFHQLQVCGVIALFSEHQLIITHENEVRRLLFLLIMKNKNRNKYVIKDLLELQKCV